MKFLWTIILFFALILTGLANVTVTWDPSPDQDITQYRLYREGTAEPIARPSAPPYRITGLPAGNNILTVTAVNSAGIESARSNTLVVNVPPGPGNFRTVTETPQANGMKLDISGAPAKRLALLRKGQGGKWKKIHTFKNFLGTATYLDKEWKEGKPFEWKVEEDKA